MNFVRRFATGVAAITTAVVVACSGKTLPARGGLMVAIESDGTLEADKFKVQVTSSDSVLFHNEFKLPDTPLPSNVSIVSDGNAATTATITVTAWRELPSTDPTMPPQIVAADRRDAIVTQIPNDHIALLVVRLSAKCAVFASLDDGKNVVSTCDDKLTCSPDSGNGGICISANVSARTLPDFGTTEEAGAGGIDGGPVLNRPDGGPVTCTDSKGESVDVGGTERCSSLENGTSIVFPLGEPKGACRMGTRTCLDTGSFGSCLDAVAPKGRDCTSANDNDCNGVIDNSECTGCLKVDTTQGKIDDVESCFPFPLPQKPVGSCKAGTRKCQARLDRTALEWGECEGFVKPPTFGKDDLSCTATSDENCNGVIGEACPCIANVTKRTCGDCKATVVTCKPDGSGYPACPASSLNTYNGIAVGGACSGGTGACFRSGNVVCPANGQNATCSSLPAAPGARVCASGSDNDCNGIADNAESACKCDGSFPPGQTQSGAGICVGNCQNGSRYCRNNGSSASFDACSGIKQNNNKGYSSLYSSNYHEFGCCYINDNIPYGGSCGANNDYLRTDISQVSGGGTCQVTAAAGGADCSVNVNFHNNGFEGAQCYVNIYQVGTCRGLTY